MWIVILGKSDSGREIGNIKSTYERATEWVWLNAVIPAIEFGA
jgi:hypothetical protein